MEAAKKSLMLTVNYKDYDAEFELDSVIRGVVGRPELGRTWQGDTKLRNMTFAFKANEEGAAKKALKRLKDQKLKAEIAAKIDAKGVQNYTLTPVKTEEVKKEDKVVGSCDGGTMKIVYVRK